MQAKAILGSLLGGATVLLLWGCGPSTISGLQEPRLLIEAQRGRLTVKASVLNVSGDLFRWDWGDGTVTETPSPQASYTYTAYAVYTITVEVYSTHNSGDGKPGPGGGTSYILQTTLSAVVDIRPPVLIRDVAVVVRDPPYWYNPNTWPPDTYPSSCTLDLYLVYEQTAPTPVIQKVIWYVFREDTFVLQAEGEPGTIPYNIFIGPGCRGERKPYRIFVKVFLSDGTLLEEQKTIYACPPQGC